MLTRAAPVALLVLAVVTRSNPPAEARTFADPAPPAVRQVPDVPLPAAQIQPGLKFHGPAKPLTPGAVTHDWRTFLGPTHNAISTETPLLKRFGASGPAIVWEVTKGQGYASAAVVDERVVLFHRTGDQEIVECLQADTGRRYWTFSYSSAYRDRYNFGGGPKCQPVSDGQWVYTLGVEGKLHCLKLTTGQVRWKRDILRDFGLTQNHFGVGAAPLIEGDLLIVNVGAPSGPCVAAFNKHTGKMVWGAGDQWGPSYASPVPADVQGRRRVFVFAGGESRPTTGGLLALDPTNGKIDFRYPWRAKRFESVNASSPLIVGDQVYIAECYGPGGVLLDLLADGSARKAWNHRLLNTHFMTPIHQDGYLYGISGHGPRRAPLVCVRLSSGKQLWRHEPEWEETIQTQQGKRRFKVVAGMASLIRVDGRCLMLGEFGHLVWLDLNPEGYRELDRVHLFPAPQSWSMPALSRGLLYVCQNQPAADGTPRRLICYDLRAENP